MTERKRILAQLTMNFIYRYYPEWKQKSDNADWLLYTTRISTYSSLSIDEIGRYIYQSVARILEGQSDFQTELDNLCQVYDYKEGWEQLLKVGIRVGWVNMIKQIHFAILNDTSIPNEKLYYAVREKYIPLTKFLS
jgi:hypothetical protein